MFGHQDDNHQDQQPADNTGHSAVLDNGQNSVSDNVPTVVDTSPALSPQVVNPALPDNTSPFSPLGSTHPASNDTIAAVPPAHSANDLLDIKQQALQQLTPLVGHLDQNPEEKFRTTMMMIQASDDQSLIKVAYDAAQQISDEKTKAQALLDIVNEINYFTHPAAEA